MKTIPRISLLILSIFMLVVSCKQSESTTEESVASEKAAVASDKAPEILANAMPERKFIRTADLRFRVENVSKSTDAIENTCRRYGGFVADSELESTTSEQHLTKISLDSTLESTKYTVTNTIVLRVPNHTFDTVVQQIAKEIAFIDNRSIKADDVALQLLSHEMAQRRSASHQKRLEQAIDNKGKKLNQITDAEDQLNTIGTDADDHKIQQLALEDKVNFSTITLKIYQRETVHQEIIANDKEAHSYQPQLGFRLWDGVKSGWYLLENILVFFTEIWSLILLGALIYLIIKKYGKNIK